MPFWQGVANGNQALTAVGLLVVSVVFLGWRRSKEGKNGPRAACSTPESVNYHFTRKCNYSCGFCFHTAKTSFVLGLEESKMGLEMLKNAGMKKINFSGGEPFTKPKYLGELVRFCKRDLQLESVTIICNGSLVKEHWFDQYGEYLDIMAVSCDSFHPETNEQIGRSQGNKNHLEAVRYVQQLCEKYKIAFKLNTVVNTFNKDENMVEEINALRPMRWKVFQCLVIPGENAGPDALRNAERYVITDEEFDAFLARHRSIQCLRPESNKDMRHSYYILDEYMRFLDGGTKQPSKSILDVGVAAAIDQSHFDERAFLRRGGKYNWSKGNMALDCGATSIVHIVIRDIRTSG